MDDKLYDALNIYNNMMINAYASLKIEEGYEFSAKFERKMNRLIQSQEKPFYSVFNTKKKRIVLGAALIAILMTSACSVPAIREPIINFVIEVYEDFTTLVFPNNLNEKAGTFEKAKIVIPEGYTSKELLTETSYFLELKNNEKNVITFEQILLSNSQVSIDTENTTYEKIIVNGLDGIYYKNKGMNVIVWSNDSYNYIISGNIETKKLFEIAESVK